MVRIRVRRSRASDLRILESEWIHCTRCPLGAVARKHALWDLPFGSVADVLFVGEGSGVVEDVKGIPFKGPSGKLLRSALAEACPEGVTWGLTNLVACRPHLGHPSAGKNRAPAAYEVEACQPRLETLLMILSPSVVVSCGQVPEAWISPLLRNIGSQAYHYNIRHPAWVIRQANLDKAYASYVNSIKAIFEEQFPEKVSGGRLRYFYHPESEAYFTLPEEEVSELYAGHEGGLCVEITEEEFKQHGNNT